jgi:hypothetical protein
MEKAGKLVDLVGVLRAQHLAGRPLTYDILQRAQAGLKTPEEQRRAGESMRRFIRMYRPHAAREDTVLFPAFRAVVGDKDLASIGEAMEEKEKSLPRDFMKTVSDVADIERAFGIADLRLFTP